MRRLKPAFFRVDETSRLTSAILPFTLPDLINALLAKVQSSLFGIVDEVFYRME